MVFRPFRAHTKSAKLFDCAPVRPNFFFSRGCHIVILISVFSIYAFKCTFWGIFGFSSLTSNIKRPQNKGVFCTLLGALFFFWCSNFHLTKPQVFWWFRSDSVLGHSMSVAILESTWDRILSLTSWFPLSLAKPLSSKSFFAFFPFLASIILLIFLLLFLLLLLLVIILLLLLLLLLLFSPPFLPSYRWLQNGYISNSKTLKSVSVSASVTVMNSQTIKVGICNPENRQITDMVTDLP